MRGFGYLPLRLSANGRNGSARSRPVRLSRRMPTVAPWLLALLFLSQLVPTALHLCTRCIAAEVSRQDCASSATNERSRSEEPRQGNPADECCPCERAWVAVASRSLSTEARKSITHGSTQPPALGRGTDQRAPLKHFTLVEETETPAGPSSGQLAMVCRFNL